MVNPQRTEGEEAPQLAMMGQLTVGQRPYTVSSGSTVSSGAGDEGSFADMQAKDDPGDERHFCCSPMIFPKRINDENWNKDHQNQELIWQWPPMKVHESGIFKLSYSNTDLLNLMKWKDAWKTSRIIKIKVRPAPEERNAPNYGYVTECPLDAQLEEHQGSSDVVAECRKRGWVVTDGGKGVKYASDIPLSVGRQRATRFASKTTSVILDGAKMSHMVHGFVGDLELDTLSLSFNQFTKLPSIGSAALTLRDLDISNNALEELDLYVLREMVKLKVLKANNNRIKQLLPNIFEEMVLEEIYLSDNLLSELPSGLFSKPTSMLYLATLDLSGNNIQTLGDENFFNYSHALVELNLRGNPMKDVRPFLVVLPSYELVLEDREFTTEDASVEPIQVTPRGKIQRFYADLLSISSIDNNFFANMVSLIKLELKVSMTVASQLTYDLFLPMGATLQELTLHTEDAFRVPTDFLHPLQALRSLKWTDSGITSIADRFVGLRNLKYLDLTGNIIYTLPRGVFDDLPILHSLRLTNNSIEWIHPNVFNWTKGLKEVFMEDNELTFLKKSVWIKLHDPDNKQIPEDQRPNLIELQLGDNPLKCTPLWMEGPESKWMSKIQRTTSLYEQSPGFCTLCKAGTYAATFDNEGLDCRACPEGALCPYDRDEDMGTFTWTMIWCPPGQWIGAGEGKGFQDCKPCPPGHFCPGEGEVHKCDGLGMVCEGGCINECYKCPPGTMANYEHTRCLTCETGTYGKSGLHCTDCPGGTYGDTQGLYNASCSGLCAIGAFCPEGSTTAEQELCPAGSYGDAEGMTDNWCSGLCDIGSFCPEGSTMRYGMPCASGRYGSQPGEPDAGCSGPCSPEHWCPIGSTAPDNVKCPDGLVSRVGDKKCFSCAPDHWSSNGRWPLCTDCGGGRTFNSSVFGLHSENDDEGDSGGVCVTCELGSYNFTINPYGIYQVSECRECPPGTWNNKWFSQSIDDCRPCPINTWSSLPGITSPFECIKCEMGTFSDRLGADHISTCEHCPPGTFFKEPEDQLLMYDKDAVCYPCGPGAWTDGLDGICHLCEIGYWSDEEQRPLPCDELCEHGYLCPVGSVNPRQFTVPQGNDLPVLEYPFWVGTSFCFTLAFTVLFFRVC